MYFGFKDTKPLGPTRVKEFRRPEGTGVKVASGDEDEIDALKLGLIDDPGMGEAAKDGAMESSEKKGERPEAKDDKGRASEKKSSGH